jgi:exopolysaccharide biosynthesis predicted pyruvyltransferase EpsI
MSNKLEDAIFNDRAAAKEQLDRMAASLNERTPSDQRLSYLNAASFLDNQYYHFEAALVHLDQAKAIIPRRAHAQIFELHLDRAAILLNLRRLPEVQFKNLGMCTPWDNCFCLV